MAKEEIGCYFQHNREASLFQPLFCSPVSSASSTARIIKLCLPIRYQFCFSNHHQRLLFHLMDLCKTDKETNAKVIPLVIKFIERADPRDPLWISCCESGFAFNLMKKTIAVSEPDDRDAIAGFLVYKMHEMSELLMSNDTSLKENAKILIQEIFHTIAASPNADWLSHQEKISLAVRNSLSACIPFDTPVSACLAMKTLLCGREVARQLLALQLRSNDSAEDELIITNNNLTLAASTLESLYDSAEILLHSDIAIDRSSLVKVAIQLQLNCCRHAAVPQTFYQKSIQHVIAYLESHDAFSLHRAFILEAQSMYSVEYSKPSPARIDITKRDISSLNEIYSILHGALGTALAISDEQLRRTSIHDIAVAAAKLISSSLSSTTSFLEQDFFLGDGLLGLNSDNSASLGSSNSVHHRHLALQAISMVRKCVHQIARLLQLSHGEATDPTQSSCAILIGNCMSLVESHVFDESSATDVNNEHNRSLISTSEVSLIFLSMISHAIRHVGIKEQIYRFLFKISQKRVHGSMLLLIVSSLAQMITTEGHSLGFSIHTQHASPVEDLPHLMSLLLKLEERLLYLCKETMVTVLEHQPNDQHALATVNRTSFLWLRSKVRGVFQSITIVARSLLYESNKLELEVRFGTLVERFLAMMIDLFPLTQQYAQENIHNNTSTNAPANSKSTVNEFTSEILIMILEAIATILEGINDLTIASVTSADGIQLQDDTFGNLSKYIRLWVGLTICQVKLPISMKSLFQLVLYKLAKATPPLVFGKFLGISKSTDLADELIIGDPTMSDVVSKCLTASDKASMQGLFGFPSNGISTASFFFLHAVQQLETLRVISAVDIRPMVGYFSDLAQWTSTHKQKIIRKIAKKVEDRWLEAVNHYLLSFDVVQEDEDDDHVNNQQHANLKCDDATNYESPRRESLDDNSTFLHIQVAPNNFLSSFGAIRYSLPQFNRLLMDQVLFLLERTADDRDHVRFFAAKLLIRMISELSWMVGAFPATNLLCNALEALAAIESAWHTSSAYNPYDSSTAKRPSNNVNDNKNEGNEDDEDEFLDEMSEEGGELYLMGVSHTSKSFHPGKYSNNRFVSRHEWMLQQTLQRHLSMKVLLPPLSFPLREDRLQAVSFDLMIVIYYWLSFSGLSLALKESLLAKYLEKYGKRRSPTSISTVIVLEMLSNSRPIYQHIKTNINSSTARGASGGAGGSGGSAADSEAASPFSQVRAQAVQQVQHLLEHRKKAQSTAATSRPSVMSTDRLFDNTALGSGSSRSNMGGNHDFSTFAKNTNNNSSKASNIASASGLHSDTVSQSILSLLGGNGSSSGSNLSALDTTANTGTGVLSDKDMRRRIVLSFRELVDHSMQKLQYLHATNKGPPKYSGTVVLKIVFQVIQHVEDMLRLLKKEQSANSRLWPVAIVGGELCRIIEILFNVLTHFATNAEVTRRVYDVLRRTLTLFPQFQALLWTMFLTGLEKVVTISLLVPLSLPAPSADNNSDNLVTVRGIYSSLQYPMQLLSLALDARVASIFHMARVTAQSILRKVEIGLKQLSFATSTVIKPVFVAQCHTVSIQVLILSTFKVLRMFHLLKGHVPVACNRILRECLYATKVMIQPANHQLSHVSERILVQTDDPHYNPASSASEDPELQQQHIQTLTSYGDESHERIRECMYWCQMLRDVLDDRVRWHIDYDRSSQQQHFYLQNQMHTAAKTSTIATDDHHYLDRDITNNVTTKEGISSMISPSQTLSLDNIPPALYYGGEAAVDIILLQMCRFQSALKKLPGFLPNPVNPPVAQTPKLTEYQCIRHRRFTLGIIDALPQTSGLQTNAKKLSSLLETAGLLTAWVLLVLRRIDGIVARYLFTYNGTVHLDAPHQIQALGYLHDIQELLDVNAFTKDIKAYKMAIKSLWNFHPPLVLFFQEKFQELSLEDGRRKGISHPHMFLFVHLLHRRTHGLQQGLKHDATRVVPKLLELLSHPLLLSQKDAVSPEQVNQVWYLLDTLPVAPIHILVQHLSRCQCFLLENNNAFNDFSNDVNNNANNNDTNTVNTRMYAVTSCKQLMSGWMRYVQRCLLHTDKQTIFFYLPELVQLLRQDLTFGVLETCLRDMATSSPLLCHQLIWLLQTESTSVAEESALKRLFQQQKRSKHALTTHEQQEIVYKNTKYGFCGQLSGMDPLPTFSRHLVEEITQALPDNQYNYLRNELAFFNYITDISHQLKSVKSKDQHNMVAKELLQQVKDVPEGIYLPTRPFRRVKAIDLDSATPMQSAAKCPFLLKFHTVQWKGPDVYLDAITERHLLVRTPSRVFKSTVKILDSPAVTATEDNTTQIAKRLMYSENKNSNGNDNHSAETTVMKSSSLPSVSNIRNNKIESNSYIVSATTKNEETISSAADSQSNNTNNLATQIDNEEISSTKSIANESDNNDNASLSVSTHTKKKRRYSKRKSSHVDHNQSLMNLLDESQPLLDNPDTNATSSTVATVPPRPPTLHPIDESSSGKDVKPSSSSIGEGDKFGDTATLDNQLHNNNANGSASIYPPAFTSKMRITVAVEAEGEDSEDEEEDGSEDEEEGEEEEVDLEVIASNVRFSTSSSLTTAENKSNSVENPSQSTSRKLPFRRRKSCSHINNSNTALENPATVDRPESMFPATPHKSPSAGTNIKFTSPARSSSPHVPSSMLPTSAAAIYRHHIALESHDENYRLSSNARDSDSSSTLGWDACIFKVHDDCRQDLLTLQVIRLLNNCFLAQHLPIYLMPYNIVCNRTGVDGNIGGILQVINQVSSRDQLGKAGAKTLLQYFIAKFGAIGSEAFHTAQLSFARSLAAYAVVCYILHIKDRHNGNILFDARGHVLHIDFGFILGISPGNNLGFEKAPFKLSQEMVELMGGTASEVFKQFKILTIQCFLAARQVMDVICAMVSSFADSELPCFQYKAHVLYRLRRRFVPEKNEVEAAVFMAGMVDLAAKDWTSSAYDGVQKLQNNIYSPEWK